MPNGEHLNPLEEVYRQSPMGKSRDRFGQVHMPAQHLKMFFVCEFMSGGRDKRQLVTSEGD